MQKINPARSQVIPVISKTILKLSTLSLSMMCLNAYAAETTQPADDTQAVQVAKVSVTGSSIKGVAAQSSSPITVIKVEDLVQQGVTTAEEALTKISANQAGYTTSQNVGASNTSGSTANLRGLGSDKTLVLLNGRRLAYSPNSTSETNLNTIPLALVERIEVLRDGASAVYGADAIAGVINFITKKEYQGFGISGGLLQPEDDGGQEYDATVFGGYGDLDEQGFNVYAAVNYHKSNDINAKDRRVSRRGGLIPELGIDARSANGFPANFYDPTSGVLGNPYGGAANCNNLENVTEEDGFCYLNTQALIAIQPETEDLNALGRATFKLSDNFNAIAEYVYAKNEVTTSIAPDVYSRSVTLPSTSPYYPGNGITPAVDGLSGDPLQLYLRSQAGNRVSKSTNESHRVFAGIEGEAYGWDIDTGVTYAYGKAEDSFVSGYLNRSLLQAGLDDGTINPFGDSADSSIWGSLGVSGTSNTATLDSTTFDFTLSRPIFTLPAGDVGFAVGGSFTTQDWESKVNSDLVRLVPGSGIDPDKPKSEGDRDITAVFSELQIPITSTLEAQLAARYDDYSDFGDTFNPKVGLRWEPIKQLMFRSTYSTGFRAPSLYEINANQSKTYTSAKYDDPVLCPGGVPTESKYQTECNTQFMRMQGGNSELQPEESTTYTFGFVFEPVKNLVLAVDYYNIEIENLIGLTGEASIFGDPEKYADRFVRDSDGRIDYINTTLMNTGGIKTEGVDVSLDYLTPMTSTGRFGFGINGTYVIKNDYQEEKGGDWEGLVGVYADPAVLRWKHTANINWSFEDWKLVLEQQFFRGYHDQNETGEDGYDNHKVPDYTLYNFSGTYKGFKNLELTGGIKNLFNEEPAASNVIDNFQYGYDPRYSDPTGRTYFLRGTYKF